MLNANTHGSMAFLNQERQKEIDQIIGNLLSSLDMSYPDNNLLEIVKGLGINVFNMEFEALPEQFQNAQGIVDVEGKKIYLSNIHNQEVQTFTLAHELGHYILHKGIKFRVDGYNYDNSLESMEETEANYFAASLLMPKGKIIQLLDLGATTKEMAQYFAVSEKALLTRLKWLMKN